MSQIRKSGLKYFRWALLFPVFAMGCTNFLLDPKIDPDRPDVNQPYNPASGVDAIVASVPANSISPLVNVTVNIQFASAVTGFTQADISLTNALISGFFGSGRQYGFVLTAVSRGWTGLTIPGGLFLEENGQQNEELMYYFNFQPQSLVLGITTVSGGITASSPIPVTFTFSESVQGFENTDVILSPGGTSLINLTGSGAVYTAQLIPSAPGEIVIAVPAGAATAGSVGSDPAQLSITYSTSIPTATLAGSVTNGGTAGYQTIIFTLNFNEPVTGLGLADIISANADIASLSGSGQVYTFAVTPLDVNSPTSIDLDLVAGAVANSAGTPNLLTHLITYTYDPSKVAANFSSALFPPGISRVTSNNTVPISLAFDRPMDYEGITEADLVLSNCSLSGPMTGGPSVYNFSLSPTGDGIVSVSIVQASAQVTSSSGPVNMAAGYSFVYDSINPAVPAFTLKEINSGDSTGNNGWANEILELKFTGSFSDGGTDLDFEFTADNGLTWLPFYGTTYVAHQGTYTGINLRSTDQAGNSTLGAAVTNVTIDTTPPDVPYFSAIPDLVNLNNYENFSFTLEGGGTGFVFNYVFSDTSSGTLSGTGVFDPNGRAVIVRNLNSLGEGTLTLKVDQTDLAGNLSGKAQWQVFKDTIAPQAPTVVILSSSPISSFNESNRHFSYVVSNGETGANWSLNLTSTGGGTVLTSAGTFGPTGTFTGLDTDLRTMRDGTLTLTGSQTDSAGNQSPLGSATIILKATVKNAPQFDDDVTPLNVTSYFWNMESETGAAYSYTIASTTGGTPTAGNGIMAGDSQLIGPLNLSALNDGFLILTVSVSDGPPYNNNSVSVRAVKKDSTFPDTGIADFSGEPGGVSFDLSNHNTQSVPSRRVKFDTHTLIGSAYNDVILFSALEDGEVFTVDGGSGLNTINLSAYTGNQIEIVSNGDTLDLNLNTVPKLSANKSGHITIDLGNGESATIHYINFEKFIFNSKIFDGTPHGLTLKYPLNGGAYFRYHGGTYVEIKSQPNASGDFGATAATSKAATAVIDYRGSMGLNYEAAVIFNSKSYGSDPVKYNFQGPGTGSGGYHNAGLFFDYLSDSDYKPLNFEATNKRWGLGGQYIVDKGVLPTASDLARTGYYGYVINPDGGVNVNIPFTTTLRVTGADGKTASLYRSDRFTPETEYFVHTYTYPDALNTGGFAVSANSAWSEYSIQIHPANWSPYVKNYTIAVSRSAAATVNVDVLGDAEDFELQPLVLSSVGPAIGTAVKNGNGTITYTMPTNPGFYGIDEVTYSISDGVNQTTGTIRFDIIP